MNVHGMDRSMRADRSRLGFVAGAVALIVTLGVGHRASAQARPAGRITVYKEPT
ncbi:MAG TPA: hypothetical protein VLB12_10470 [Gemmatimonadales bacterium]|nr:hypothetical protein [Gemmatimonadales bacterium]